MSSSDHMKQKAFIEASCNNNMHTGEKVFGVRMFGTCFFLGRVKKNYSILVLCDSSLDFQKR